MIGARSIILNFKITNNKNAKSPYEVKVQANKNYGLCDVILPGTPVEPEKTYITLQKEERKQEKALYDERKSEYDLEMSKRKIIRNALFDRFQGQQLNNPITVKNLKNALYVILNTTEL